MWLRWLSSLRFFLPALRAEHTPHQLALGLALGVTIGLVPKGNLTAVILTALLFSLRVNLASGLLAACFISGISLWLDPVTHHLGEALLTIRPLEPLYAGLYRLPVVPWTALNNTVVAGSLFLGLLQFYPTYRGSRIFFAKHGPTVLEYVRQHRYLHVLYRGKRTTSWRVG